MTMGRGEHTQKPSGRAAPGAIPRSQAGVERLRTPSGAAPSFDACLTPLDRQRQRRQAVTERGVEGGAPAPPCRRSPAPPLPERPVPVG